MKTNANDRNDVNTDRADCSQADDENYLIQQQYDSVWMFHLSIKLLMLFPTMEIDYCQQHSYFSSSSTLQKDKEQIQ
jgi:hypothetical protein